MFFLYYLYINLVSYKFLLYLSYLILVDYLYQALKFQYIPLFLCNNNFLTNLIRLK